MSAPAPRMTRGHGLLEPMLARWRARLANRMIPERLHPSTPHQDIAWHTLDLNAEPKLPFADGYFSVITLLAVVEHLNPESLVQLLRESRRALQPGGILLLTTPAAWSDGLLHLMAHIRLVSHEEIEEHKYAYTLPLLGWYFGMAGFAMTKVRFGYFECRLNMWATAER